MSTGCWSLCTRAQSACSVNAMADRPSSSARAQLRSMSPWGASHGHAVCTWRSGGSTGQGYNPDLVGYVVEGLAYVGGAFLIGAGLYLVMRGTFPAWWRKRMLWPLVNVTPRVSHLQGWAEVALGISILSIVFTTVAPEMVAGILVVVAFVTYLGGVVLYLFSTWLSRRPAS